MTTSAPEDEWLWGWDPTPGIVSVWADARGRVAVWRRIAETGALVRELARFRPWVLIDRADGLQTSGHTNAGLTVRELDGPGALRYLVSADDGHVLAAAVLADASRRFGRRLGHLRELGKEHVLVLPPEEQDLVMTGRTYLRGLAFDQVHRLQFDLETTGLDPERDRIFLVAVRDPAGRVEVLEAQGEGDAAESDLIARLVERIRAADPDVIENHNLHGFDLPFLERRADRLGVPIAIARIGPPGLRRRAARRGVVRAGVARPGEGRAGVARAPVGRDGSAVPWGLSESVGAREGASERTGAREGASVGEAASEGAGSRRVRLVAPGRELIDTLDAVLRHDLSARDLPGHGLKAVARHLGLAAPDREYIRGDRIHDVYRRDPDRVRRYAAADVEEVSGVSRLLGGAAFALARMAPRRYERLADAGAATGVIDPLLVRAYLRAGMALPAHQPGDGTTHSGAALHLFASGVATRVVKADVASLYPSLMRAYRIGPARDRLGAMIALVDRLVDWRLRAKASARAAPAGSADRFMNESMSAAMKLVVNSAYGYLAAGGGLTRFADVHAANEVTRRGREVLDLMCRELAARGVTLVEADTDGVYFSVPETWAEQDERRVVADVAALLPPLVQLEFDGRYRAMLSHEPKNYALQGYDDTLVLRGVAFRSSRAEPFGEAFLRRAVACLLAHEVAGVRAAWLDTVQAIRRRELATREVSSRVRLTKTPAQYRDVRDTRRELTYEAMLAAGRTSWSVGERVRVYRTATGAGGVVPIDEEEEEERRSAGAIDPRDYDVDHYVRVLRVTFASRLVRALTPADFAAVFADPGQPSLFTPSFATMRPILSVVG